MKTKYYEYNRHGDGEKYSEFTEAEYLKAKEDENRWFISFGDSVLECEESEYRNYFSEKNHFDYTQRDKYGKKIIPILLEQYTYSDSDCAIVSDSTNVPLTQKSASPRVTQSENPRYTFRTWLIRIGLNGEEFKNCRKHLLSHLDGNIAWLHPEDAIEQWERLKAERIAAREQHVEPVSEIRQEIENVPDEALEPQEHEREVVFEDEEFEQEETFEMSM